MPSGKSTKSKKEEMNFVPSEEEIINSSISNKFFHFFTNRGKLIIIITEAIVLLVFLSRFKLDRDISDLKENIENKNAIIESTKSIEKDFREVQKNVNTIDTITKNQINWFAELESFDSKIPQGMILDSISYNNEVISLSAKVNSAEAFATFIGNTIANPKVKSVVLVSSSYDTNSKEYSFKMNILRDPIRNDE